jgi:hypothetical protein
MRLLLIVAALAGFGASVASAQTAPGAAPSSRDPSAARPTMGTTPTGTSQERGAASGDSNQAVATTSANAAEPAKGANSFTEGEARTRLEKSGFQDVSGLQKDQNGIWRGHARKNGRQAEVWLDYKGNIGTGRM